MSGYKNILVIQTAFLGDVILTLPLVQAVHSAFPESAVDMIVTPRAADVLVSHPALRAAIVYDKRGGDAGVRGFVRLCRSLRPTNYDLALVPHRSLRSAALAACAGIRRRIGFAASAGRFLYTDQVPYERSLHEVQRNLGLLDPLHVSSSEAAVPRLYPSPDDCAAVDRTLQSHQVGKGSKLIGIAPGTAWNTKRWPQEGFARLCGQLIGEGHTVLLIGGAQDRALCDGIQSGLKSPKAVSVAGTLTLLQSAELIRRCRLIVCNDSAPVHMALAMQTPVVAIFGATVPGFGFAPYGTFDAVVETAGLACRPCSIHGGDRCPISTFECMTRITPEIVHASVRRVLENIEAGSGVRV